MSTPAAGELRIAGQTLRQGGSAWRRHWVYVGHQNALKDDLTATEALRFLAELHGAPHDPASLTRALKRMGILNRQHAPVRTLSQGQRRRVALSRLLLSAHAPLWLLDEPLRRARRRRHRRAERRHRRPRRCWRLRAVDQPPGLVAGASRAHGLRSRTPCQRMRAPTTVPHTALVDTAPTASSVFLTVLRRDLKLASRRRIDALLPLPSFWWR